MMSIKSLPPKLDINPKTYYNIHIPTKERPIMTTTSSTGGSISHTKTGLFHYQNTEKFTVEQLNTDSTTNSEFKCDWHPYFAPEVKLTGPSGRVITFNK